MDLREQPAKKRERPKLYLTKEMVEERRVLKRLRRNARRNFSGGIPQQDRRSVVSDEDPGPATLFDNHETPDADEAIGRGSHQLHQVISQKKRDFLYTNSILDLGNRDQVCGFCEAHVWADEYTDIHVGDGPKGYSICCGKGKVQLPLLGETPAELHELLTSPGKRSRIFFNSSRVYNNMFAFSSFGGKIDDSVIRR